MSENTMTGWVTLYAPQGVQIKVPVPVDGTISTDAAAAMLQSVANLINAGFAVTPEGVNKGEQVFEVEAICRREKENKDGTTTPIIDLYPERWKFRAVGIYLNTPEDVAAFEKACRVKLAALPVYEGSPLERDDSNRARRYIKNLPFGAKAVLKPNPRYEGPEDKRHQKRVFVRWMADAGSNAAPSAPSEPPAPPEPPSTPPAPPAPEDFQDFDKPADTPLPADYVVPIGKNRGRTLSELSLKAIQWYAEEMEPRTAAAVELQQAARQYMDFLTVA